MANQQVFNDSYPSRKSVRSVQSLMIVEFSYPPCIPLSHLLVIYIPLCKILSSTFLFRSI